MNAQQPQGPQLAILAATFYVIEASWQLAYAGGGARLAGWLNSARRLAGQQGIRRRFRRRRPVVVQRVQTLN